MDLSTMLQAGIPHVDVDGNTLFHKAVVDITQSMEALDEISKLGVDIDQANYAGRTPLHAFCSVGWYDESLSGHQVEYTRRLLQRIKNIDAADADGVRPLHLASMMSEYIVKELLAFGADPAGETSEGLTSLHLAARARQSNIVGILIAALGVTSSQDANSGFNNDGKLAVHLNAKDKVGRSPLHYACRSGRHETVTLLLDAGANPEIEDEKHMGLLDACAEFEEEQDLWAEYLKPMGMDWNFLERTSIPKNWNEVAVAGTKIHDRLRPWVTAGKTVAASFRKTYGEGFLHINRGIRSHQDTTRLEEILQMLFESAMKREKGVGSMSIALGRCIQYCELNGYVYTLRCFKDLETKVVAALNPAEFKSKLSDDESGTRCRQQDQELLRTVEVGRCSEDDYIDVIVVDRLLRMREYSVIERLLRRGSCSNNTKAIETGKILRLLAKHGFAHLLGNILRFEDSPSAAIIHGHQPEAEQADPLLFVACQRDLPNMDVVRLLVEEVGVDLNAKSRTTEQRIADLEDENEEVDVGEESIPGQNTALHELAMGRHWWSVTQGIPYLLSSGADPKQCNEADATPLQTALDSIPRETFVEEAEETLKMRD